MAFAEMSPSDRAHILEWAHSHDWGREAVMAPSSSGPILTGVVGVLRWNDGSTTEERPTFRDLESLRVWAGY